MTSVMTVTCRDGSKTRHQPSSDMTFGLSLNYPREQAIRLPVPHHLGAEEVRDYNNGWAAGARSTASGDEEIAAALLRFAAADVGGAGYDDGFMDRVAGREKWHLAWCAFHCNGIEGCGRA